MKVLKIFKLLFASAIYFMVINCWTNSVFCLPNEKFPGDGVQYGKKFFQDHPIFINGLSVGTDSCSFNSKKITDSINISINQCFNYSYLVDYEEVFLIPFCSFNDKNHNEGVYPEAFSGVHPNYLGENVDKDVINCNFSKFINPHNVQDKNLSWLIKTVYKHDSTTLINDLISSKRVWAGYRFFLMKKSEEKGFRREKLIGGPYSFVFYKGKKYSYVVSPFGILISNSNSGYLAKVKQSLIQDELLIKKNKQAELEQKEYDMKLKQSQDFFNQTYVNSFGWFFYESKNDFNASKVEINNLPDRLLSMELPFEPNKTIKDYFNSEHFAKHELEIYKLNFNFDNTPDYLVLRSKIQLENFSIDDFEFKLFPPIIFISSQDNYEIKELNGGFEYVKLLGIQDLNGDSSDDISLFFASGASGRSNQRKIFWYQDSDKSFKFQNITDLIGRKNLDNDLELELIVSSPQKYGQCGACEVGWFLIYDWNGLFWKDKSINFIDFYKNDVHRFYTLAQKYTQNPDEKKAYSSLLNRLNKFLKNQKGDHNDKENSNLNNLSKTNNTNSNSKIENPLIKINQAKNNMHRLQMMLETYMFDEGGECPKDLDLLKYTAINSSNPYWQNLVNPFTSNKGIGISGAMIDYSEYKKVKHKGSQLAGLIIYEPILSDKIFNDYYRIWHCDQNGKIIDNYFLSNTPDKFLEEKIRL